MGSIWGQVDNSVRVLKYHFIKVKSKYLGEIDTTDIRALISVGDSVKVLTRWRLAYIMTHKSGWCSHNGAHIEIETGH